MEFRLELKKFIKEELHDDIPLVMVLNKADTYERPKEWPPEEYAIKAGQLDDVMDYVASEILETTKKPINRNVRIMVMN